MNYGNRIYDDAMFQLATSRVRFGGLHSATAVMGQPQIGFIDLSLPKEMPRHNAAAFAFAKFVGKTTRVHPVEDGGWQTAENEVLRAGGIRRGMVPRGR